MEKQWIWKVTVEYGHEDDDMKEIELFILTQIRWVPCFDQVVAELQAKKGEDVLMGVLFKAELCGETGWND